MAYDLTGLLDVVKIKRTGLVGNTLSTIVAFLNGPKRSPDDPVSKDPDEDESTEIDWWQHYGFVSRPPSGAEAVIARIGGQTFALASRFLGATKFGKLGEGDVALFTLGGNVFRLNANGSISVLVPSRGKQIVARIDPKGSVQLMLGNGFAFEFSENNGLVASTPGKDITFACRNFNVVANAFNNNSPTIKTHIAATAPLQASSVAPGVFV